MSQEHSEYEALMYEDFLKNFESLCSDYAGLVQNLEENLHFEKTLTTLHHLFHTLKAETSFLKLPVMAKTFVYLEEVFAILKNKKAPLKQEILNWLYLLERYFLSWQENLRMNAHAKFERIDNIVLNMIKISSVTPESTKDLLAQLSIVVIEEDSSAGERLTELLQKKCKRFELVKSFEQAQDFIEAIEPDLVFISANISEQLMQALYKSEKELKKKIINILLYDRAQRHSNIEQLQRFDIEFLYDKAHKDLFVFVEEIVRTHFSKRCVVVSDSSIKNHIESLSPLSESLQQILNLQRQEDATVRDMAEVLKQDPILALNLLRYINSSHFSFQGEITNINQCVSMLGKEKTASFVMLHGFKGVLEPIQLSAYGISEDVLFYVSKKRMELMTNWYKKVSFMRLPILTSSALFANLGQILIQREIERQGKTEAFLQVVKEAGSKVAETEFLHTTCEDVTADILRFWGLDKTLIDSIAYSYNLNLAPKELRPFALANHIVYNTVLDTGGGITHERVQDMAELLNSFSMDANLYIEAVEKTF